MVKTKEAWGSKLVLALIAILAIIGIAFAIWITGMGPWVLSSLQYIFIDLFIGQVIIPWWTNLWTWVTVITFGITAFVIINRKKIFAKERIPFTSTSGTLQSGLIQTNPVSSAPAGTVVVQDKDEVLTEG